ncbi:MAG: hypothetical protein ACOC0P_06955 [Planctomycetota bacterium]
MNEPLNFDAGIRRSPAAPGVEGSGMSSSSSSDAGEPSAAETFGDARPTGSEAVMPSKTGNSAGPASGASVPTSPSRSTSASPSSDHALRNGASGFGQGRPTEIVPLPARRPAASHAALPMRLPGPPPGGPAGGRGGGGGGAAASIDPLRVLRQYVWWLAASVIIGVVLGVSAHLVLSRVAPVYTVDAYFEVNPPVSDSTSVGTSPQISDTLIERQMNTQAAIMMQPSLLEKAINSRKVRETNWFAGFTAPTGMGGPDLRSALRDLEERVTASPQRDSFLVKLSISGPSADDMLPILDAIKDVYLEQMEIAKQSERQNITDTLRRSIDEIVGQLARVQREIENRV